MRYALDLHGYTVHDAWKRFNEHVTNCYLDKRKTTVVVTGHGKIGNEIVTWAENHPRAVHCQRLDPNTGAYTIKITKNKSAGATPTTETTSHNSLQQLSKKYQKK